MTSAFRKRAEELYLDATELPPADRRAFLDEQCGADQPLLELVEHLLELDGDLPSGFLSGGAPATRLEPGSSFAGFELLAVLGEGGMGTVYAARQSFPSRDIALKVIRGDRLTAEALRRFEKEVQALGSLQHPGIAHVYDAGTARRDGALSDEPYLAMELVRGAPIIEHAARRNLGPRERMELLARVADAVHHAHQRGVIHRDLKPDNVLVVEDETASFPAEEAGRRLGQPKVLDFGIARLLGDPGPIETRAGELIGTLAYMSPEQLSGDSARLDERTDVYALGVLLYQLLADRLPHDVAGRSLPDTLRLLSERAPNSLESVVPQHRGDVATIAARALDVDPQQRYASAAALAQDLRRHLRGEPIRARSHSTLYVLQRSLLRYRVGVAFAAGLLIVVAVFGFALSGQSRELSTLEARRGADLERTLESLRLLAGVAEGLGEKWGVSAEQRRLLETVLASHTALLAEHGDSPKARALAARTRFEVAQVQMLLGDDEEARENLQRTIAELEETGLAGAGLRALQSTARLNLASVLLRLDELDAARAEATLALESFEADGDALFAAKAIERLARVESQSGNAAEAQRLARLAVERADSLADPTSEGAVSLHMSALTTLAEATYRLAGADSAIELYEQLSADLEQVASEEVRRALSPMIDVSLGRLWFEVGRPEQAERVLIRAVESGEELVAEMPEVHDHARLLLGALNNLGAVYGMSGRDEAAGPLLERGLEIITGLCAAYPADPDLRRQHDSLLTNAGKHRASNGRVEEGCELLERAREGWSERLESHPGDVDARDTLAMTLIGLAFARLELGDPEEAASTLADFPATADLNDVGRALSVYSMMIEGVRADAALDPTLADERAAGYARHASELLGRCTEAGFAEHRVLREDSHFEGLRGEAEFAELLAVL